MPKPHKKKKRNQTIFIDIDDTKMVKGFELGQEVTVMVKGKIKGLDAPEKSDSSFPGEGDHTFPGSIKLAATSIKVEGKNAFADLAEEEDGD